MTTVAISIFKGGGGHIRFWYFRGVRVLRPSATRLSPPPSWVFLTSSLIQSITWTDFDTAQSELVFQLCLCKFRFWYLWVLLQNIITCKSYIEWLLIQTDWKKIQGNKLNLDDVSHFIKINVFGCISFCNMSPLPPLPPPKSVTNCPIGSGDICLNLIFFTASLHISK